MGVDFKSFNEMFDKDEIKEAEKKYKEIEDNSGQHKQIPSGVYRVKLDSMEKKDKKNKNGQPYSTIDMVFTIIEGEFKKWKLFNNAYISSDYGKYLTAGFISDMTDNEVSESTVLAMMDAEDCNKLILELFQELSKQTYDLDVDVEEYTGSNGKKYANMKYEVADIY